MGLELNEVVGNDGRTLKMMRFSDTGSTSEQTAEMLANTSSSVETKTVCSCCRSKTIEFGVITDYTLRITKMSHQWLQE